MRIPTTLAVVFNSVRMGSFTPGVYGPQCEKFKCLDIGGGEGGGGWVAALTGRILLTSYPLT